ncbi:MAG: DNA-processing protein DprA, partial [Dehalococcoidia bacterium]
GALAKGGKTIAVLSEGILRFSIRTVYKDIDNLFSRLLVISQYAPNLVWNKAAAMERNKTICYMSHGLVVVEAGEKGGTIEAGKECIRQRKPVWVINYKQRQENPAGNTYLIRNNAVPLSTAKELRNAFYLFATNKAEFRMKYLRQYDFFEKVQPRGI